jgi:hypothetical protein
MKKYCDNIICVDPKDKTKEEINKFKQDFTDCITLMIIFFMSKIFFYKKNLIKI